MGLQSYALISSFKVSLTLNNGTNIDDTNIRSKCRLWQMVFDASKILLEIMIKC